MVDVWFSPIVRKRASGRRLRPLSPTSSAAFGMTQFFELLRHWRKQ